MRLYVIDRGGDFIHSHKRLDAASKEARVKDGILVEGVAQLEGMSLSELVAIYNTMVDEDSMISKFRDKTTAVQRVWAYITDNATTIDPDQIRSGKSKGRPSRFSGKKIFRNQAENPRKPNTHGWHAWDLITDGMTYEEYMSACDAASIGGRGLKHLNWCYDRGFVGAE